MLQEHSWGRVAGSEAQRGDGRWELDASEGNRRVDKRHVKRHVTLLPATLALPFSSGGVVGRECRFGKHAEGPSRLIGRVHDEPPQAKL